MVVALCSSSPSFFLHVHRYFLQSVAISSRPPLHLGVHRYFFNGKGGLRQGKSACIIAALNLTFIHSLLYVS